MRSSIPDGDLAAIIEQAVTEKLERLEARRFARTEYHHRHPFGHDGRHSVEGVSLLCRTHNLYVAEIDYGRLAMARHRRSKAGSRSLGLGT